jgi:hypothetical protein
MRIFLFAALILAGCGSDTTSSLKNGHGIISTTKQGYANIFKNGHGIIYSTPEEAELNSEGRVAFKIITYTVKEE